MRLLGLDIGDKRIGVATAETEVKMAFPQTHIERQDTQQAIKAIIRVCGDQMADKVVVGNPLLESGEIGVQAQKTTAFVELLKEQLKVPVVTYDERFTSWEAEEMLKELNYTPAERKKKVDSVAAAMILNAYMGQLVEDEIAE